MEGKEMIMNLITLCEILEKERKGKTVVLGTGTFDLFHISHLEYLEEAKRQGDILVVAVKNDKCAHLKGNDRPIIPEEQRVAIVNGLKCVDYVVLVDYDPRVELEVEVENNKQKEWVIIFQELFKKLHPDILYHEINPVLATAREKVLQKYGIKGVAARRGEKSSTTKIINKIKGNKA